MWRCRLQKPYVWAHASHPHTRAQQRSCTRAYGRCVRHLTSTENEVTMPTLAEMRHKLQMARVQRQWTVAKLAYDVGVPTEALAAFERGEDTLPMDKQNKLRKLLGIR